ncbi:MAG: hypothetical protein J5680_04200 [Neisseriaceae bacterium]|nr:hypothetical protein [Neisseriaceae bacterium]
MAWRWGSNPTLRRYLIYYSGSLKNYGVSRNDDKHFRQPESLFLYYQCVICRLFSVSPANGGIMAWLASVIGSW